MTKYDQMRGMFHYQRIIKCRLFLLRAIWAWFLGKISTLFEVQNINWTGSSELLWINVRYKTKHTYNWTVQRRILIFKFFVVIFNFTFWMYGLNLFAYFLTDWIDYVEIYNFLVLSTWQCTLRNIILVIICYFDILL